jgi:L-rhamnose mutarotase
VSDATHRACFVIRLRPGSEPDYIRRHSPVWPEMLLALQRTGWSNYSIFLHPDGFVVGYFESEDLDGTLNAMGAEEVNRRWQSASAEFFDSELVWLPIVFNLEDQLRQIGH